MSALNNIIFLSQADYNTLYTTGTVTIDGTTLTYSPDNLYFVPDILESQASSTLQPKLLSAPVTIEGVSETTVEGAITALANSSGGGGGGGTYLPLAGGTMTGQLKTQSSVNSDSRSSGALHLQNSNIIGVNAIYMADSSDNAGEAINWVNSNTTLDSLWANGGVLLFSPNRTDGTATTVANSQKVGRFTANPTSGQVVITDGAYGGIKASGYTIAKSVPSDAKFTDTTYSSEAAASGGTTLSLVTTGEKYTWNNKTSLTIGTTSTTAAAGNHTHNYAGSDSAGGAANNVAGVSGTANTSRHVWFSDGSTETKRNHSDYFMYNPSTQKLTVGMIDVKSKGSGSSYYITDGDILVNANGFIPQPGSSTVCYCVKANLEGSGTLPSNSNCAAIYGSANFGYAGLFSGAVKTTTTFIAGTSVTAPTVYQTSDDRLKDYVGDFHFSLDDIDKIPLRVFNYKDDESKQLHIGTSAQSVQKILPQIVGSGYIKEGDDNEYLTVEYSKLSLVALDCIKQLKAEINELKAEIKKLKGE